MMIDFIDSHGCRYYFKKRKWWRIWEPKFKRKYFLTLIELAKRVDKSNATEKIKEILGQNNKLLDDIEFVESNYLPLRPIVKYTRTPKRTVRRK